MEEGLELLLEIDAGSNLGVPHWPVRVLEGTDPDLVVVIYPDKARQLQPRSWWAARLPNKTKLLPMRGVTK